VSEIINIAPERAILGESPVWSAAEGALYWVDISACRMHRAEIASRRVQSWPGLMRSILMPNRSHHTDSFERL
jgi:sugar lactone lactonase YvrE